MDRVKSNSSSSSHIDEILVIILIQITVQMKTWQKGREIKTGFDSTYILVEVCSF